MVRPKKDPKDRRTYTYPLRMTEREKQLLNWACYQDDAPTFSGWIRDLAFKRAAKLAGEDEEE